MLMRDDCYVGSFKLSRFKLRLLLTSVAAIIIVCALSIYGTYHYHEKYRLLADKQDGLKLQLTAVQINLDRATTINRSEEDLPTGSSEAVPAAIVGASEISAPIEESLPSVPGPDEVSRMLGNEPSSVDEVTTSDTESNAAVNNHVLDISGVKATVLSDSRIRLSFTLKNQSEDTRVQGYCELFVVDNLGKQHSVYTLSDKRLPFSIKSMKLMKEDFTLPQGVVADSVAKIGLKAAATGHELYEVSFPLRRN